ncbi:hypothetical protein ACMYYO_00475 [Dermacoccaceae bacterium W4C1]
MLFQKSRSEKAADKAHDLLDTVKSKLDDSDTLSHVKDVVSDTDGLKKSAKESVSGAREKVATLAAPAVDSVSETVDSNEKLSTARDKATAAAETVGSKASAAKGEADHLIQDEWLPKLQAALAAAGGAAATATAKLPEPAQDQVAKVAPELVKRKKKGGFLIVLGLAALAGAGYLYWQGQQKAAATPSPSTTPEAPAAPVSTTDDLVGDLDAKADDTLTGKHAAKD